MLFATSVLCFLVMSVALYASARTATDSSTRTMTFRVAIGAGFVGFLFLVCSCVTIISAGSIGVQVTFGKVDDTPITEGIHLINPLSTVEQLSVRTENYWMSHQPHEGTSTTIKGDDAVPVRSSNGLQMPVDVSIPYRLIPETAPWVYRNLGSNYVTVILRPGLSTAARRAASHYTAEELYSTKRDEFAEKVRTLLDEEITRTLQENYKGKNPPAQILVAAQVLVGHIDIPLTVKNAIEAKLQADQQQQAMEFQIKKAEKEAERKRVEAKGIQDFQTIVTQGISDKLLRWKAIEATLQLAESNNAKVVIIGGGKDGLPVLLSGEGDTQVVVPGKGK